MADVQFIIEDGRPRFAVVPIELWRRMAPLLEDSEDEALYEHAKAADDGGRIPADVAFAVAGGIHPVRAWRRYRGLSADALAASAGLSKGYLSQIENRRRQGSPKTLAKLARSLQVVREDLIDDDT